MRSKFHNILSAVFILVVLAACGVTPASTRSDTPPPPPTLAPFVAEVDGPPGFSATLTAPDIVQLNWEPAADAVGYKVQIVFAGLDPLTIAYLPADATQFVHYLAPEASVLTYRLQTITSSGPSGASSLQITTQRHASNPLVVQAVFSETGVVTADIGPAGGTLETADDRGVAYSLYIPPGALDTELTITMTPVSTLDGWPLDGNLLGAVKLEPEGWLLSEVAYLTITPPTARTPGLTTVGFAFNGSGEEFHLAPAYGAIPAVTRLRTGGARQARLAMPDDAGSSSLPVMEFKSTGIGEASADSAAAMPSEHAPSSSSDASDQKAAVTDAGEEELAPLLSNSELAEIATNNLLTQILNNVTDCYEFKRAVGAFHSWEGKVAALGAGSDFREAIMEELGKKAVETIEQASQECANADKGMVPASIPCSEKLTRDIQSGSSPFYTELQHAITKDPDLKVRFTTADDTSELCPHSFGIKETATIGYRWTSSCIPSLDRPYQVSGIADGVGEFIYRFYPPESNPWSGRMGGESHFISGDLTIDIVYQGTYTVEITGEGVRGYPVELEVIMNYGQEITTCVAGQCFPTSESGGHQFPLQVHDTRCPIP